MKILHLFSENLRISMRSIRANRVRAILTMLIIGFGIMALVGILSTQLVLEQFVNDFTAATARATQSDVDRGAAVARTPAAGSPACLPPAGESPPVEPLQGNPSP